MRGKGSFEDLGIGGLDDILTNVFKRTFSSRMLPPDTVQKLRLQHTKGILIHGPPGTGKTLTARQIGQLLSSRKPKHINGPEIFSSLVGQSEEEIRKIFEASEREWRIKGNNSPLHVVIFDEIDAICKRRDDANTVNKSRVHDNVVNQLLTKIDGLATQNNLLVIGVTNRRDLLDEALLRPGRLEVHIEIPLPDAVGREQILNIHTRQLEEAKMLGSSVNLTDVANRTRGFTGAELEGLSRSAIAFALADHQETLAAATSQSLDDDSYDERRGDDMSRMVELLEQQSATTVEMRHFEEALVSVERSSDLLNEAHRRDVLEGNVVDRSKSEAWRAAASKLETVASATISSNDMLTRSVLLWGDRGSGRMTTIANITESHNFESIQRLTPHDFLKRTDHHRLLTDAYEDSKRSKKSILIVEDVDQIIPLCPKLVPMLNVMMEPAPKSKTSMCVFITSSTSSVDDLVVDEIVHHPTPSSEECERYVELRSGLNVEF
jgi:vesicle-fusing ATPase